MISDILKLNRYNKIKNQVPQNFFLFYAEIFRFLTNEKTIHMKIILIFRAFLLNKRKMKKNHKIIFNFKNQKETHLSRKISRKNYEEGQNSRLIQLLINSNNDKFP